MQLELIRELSRTPGVDVDVFSVLPVATHPVEPRKIIATSWSEISPGIPSYRPGFVTLPGLKQVTQIASLTYFSAKAARSSKYDYILAFNMFPHVGVAAWWLHKRYGLPVACLLADPPVDDRGVRSRIAAALMSLYNSWTRRLLGVPERVIALTPLAAKMFAPQARAMFLDGAIASEIANTQTGAAFSTVRHDRKDIVYTGALTTYNGVIELVLAMGLVTSGDVTLHVYGKGPLTDHVRAAADAQDNIVFHGQVESSRIPPVQRDAFLLVSPRQIDHPISDITFPSKLLEYMASGTPVLTTRLRSISSEFNDRVYFAETGSPEDLAACIDELAARPPAEVRSVGALGRQFVVNHRTWSHAAQRIVQFLAQ